MRNKYSPLNRHSEPAAHYNRLRKLFVEPAGKEVKRKREQVKISNEQ
jgi:hypothetical protein